MSVTSTSLFTGWLGYGSSFSSFALTEPVDVSYTRRPIQYAPFDGRNAKDVSVGSIGPAAADWNTLCFAGLFDAKISGNLIAAIPMRPPVTVAIGRTVTASFRFNFRLSVPSDLGVDGSYVWMAGAELGKTGDGLSVIAGSNLAFSAGVLVSLGPSQAALPVSSLPSVAPETGSGQLWNNGGVICIA